MHACINEPHGVQESGEDVAAPVPFAPFDPLALPAFGPDVPYEIAINPCDTRWAQMACNWLDAGELEVEDEGEHPRILVQRAVSQWMEKQIGHLRFLADMNVIIESNLDSCLEAHEYAGIEADYDFDVDQFCSFSIEGGNSCPWFNLERPITELERIHPGLGVMAYETMEGLAAPLVPIFTPLLAMEHGRNLWWYGMDDQAEYEEEVIAMAGDNPDPEGLAADLANGPESFKGKFPGWMFTGSSELSAEALAEITEGGLSDTAKQVASLILEVKAMKGEVGQLPSLLGYDPLIPMCNAYHLAYIAWNDDDDMERLADDQINEANQCDNYTSLLGIDKVPMDFVGFQQWKTGMEAGFRALSLLDELLVLISDPC